MIGSLLNKARYGAYRLDRVEAELMEIKNWVGTEIYSEQHARGDAQLINSNCLKSNFTPDLWSWRCIGTARGVDSAGRSIALKRARAIAATSSELFVGYDGGVEGAACVWVRRDNSWEQIGGGGINGSWKHGLEVQAIAIDEVNSIIYAGISSLAHGPEVWKYYSGQWELIGSSARSDWNSPPLYSVSSMLFSDNYLYVSLGIHKNFINSARDDLDNVAPIFRYGPSGWENIGNGRTWGMENDYNSFYELWKHSDGYIYGGTYANFEKQLGHVWRFRDSVWELVGGHGIRNSWSRAPHVLRFRSFKNYLVCCMNRAPLSTGSHSPVWAFDGVEWHPVGIKNIPHQWHHMYSFNALEVWGDTLIVGSGGRPGGNAALWYLDRDNEWKLFAGYGKNSSWGKPIYRDMHSPLLSRSSTEYVYRIRKIENRLIVGFGASPGMGQIWEGAPI